MTRPFTELKELLSCYGLKLYAWVSRDFAALSELGATPAQPDPGVGLRTPTDQRCNDRGVHK